MITKTRMLPALMIAALTLAIGCRTAPAQPAPADLNLVQRYMEDSSPYRGWEYLVAKLRAHGVEEAKLKRIFQSPEMPFFPLVPYRVKPLETADMYAGYRTAQKIHLGKKFLAEHSNELRGAQVRYGVDPRIVTALLLIETHFGGNTGKEMILYRLARVASVGEPTNFKINLERLRAEDPEVEEEAARKRAEYLENRFLPEIEALIRICDQNHLKIFGIKGSIAGAFGIPQFLPSSYLKYGVDGNHDGRVSLFNMTDAIYSTANYLAQHGWTDSMTVDEKKQVLWHYNHSQPYVDTAIWLMEEFAKP